MLSVQHLHHRAQQAIAGTVATPADFAVSARQTDSLPVNYSRQLMRSRFRAITLASCAAAAAAAASAALSSSSACRSSCSRDTCCCWRAACCRQRSACVGAAIPCCCCCWLVLAPPPGGAAGALPLPLALLLAALASAAPACASCSAAAYAGLPGSSWQAFCSSRTARAQSPARCACCAFRWQSCAASRLE